MARTNTITMIPLDRVAYHLQIDPYHFNGMYTAERPFNPSCPDVWYQYGWQNTGKLSHVDVALALKQAEDNVVRWLNWAPVPQWYEEDIKLPIHYKTEMYNWINAQRRAKSVVTSNKYVLSVGAKGSTYIDTPVTAIAGDTVTISFATTVTEEQELHVFYPDKNGRAEWEIRPLTSIDITAGTATITFPKYLIPLESLVEAVPDDDDPHIGINADVDANFLATVDVYRIYVDISDQITFKSEPNYLDCTEDTPCEYNEEVGCGYIRDSKLGIVAVSRADYSDGAYTKTYFTYMPDKVTIKYRAGKLDTNLQYPYLQMSEDLERMIVYYALSLLDNELCGCNNTLKIWRYQTEDLALMNEARRYVVDWEISKNILGSTTRAALMLLSQIKEQRIVQRTP